MFNRVQPASTFAGILLLFIVSLEPVSLDAQHPAEPPKTKGLHKPMYLGTGPSLGYCQPGAANAHCQHTHGCGLGICQFVEKHHSYYQYEPQLSCPGDTIYATLQAQKLNGRIDQMIMHPFHFRWQPEQQVWVLTRSGWQKINELCRILPGTPGPLAIIPTGNPELDLARLQLVHDVLTTRGFEGIELKLVNVIGPGLNGGEAIRIYQQRQTGSPFNKMPQALSVGSLGQQGNALPAGNSSPEADSPR